MSCPPSRRRRIDGLSLPVRKSSSRTCASARLVVGVRATTDALDPPARFGGLDRGMASSGAEHPPRSHAVRRLRPGGRHVPHADERIRRGRLTAGDGARLRRAGRRVRHHRLRALDDASPVTVLPTLRLPRRSTLCGLLAVFAIGHAIAALSPALPLLVAARLITALATGGFWALSSLVATEAAGEDSAAARSVSFRAAVRSRPSSACRSAHSPARSAAGRCRSGPSRCSRSSLPS